MGKVPEESQGAFPSLKPGYLSRCWVDAAAEALADQHNTTVRQNTEYAMQINKGWS